MLQYDLGLAFQNARRFPEALAAFLRARERAAANPAATQNLSPERRAHWQALDQQIDLCRRFIRSEGILEGLRLDYVTAADPLRALELATHALLLNRPAIATRLAEEVFARQPALADDLDRNYRLIAALAAAWASCGQGEDAAALDAAERTRLRRRALDWLRADLAASPPARIQPWLTHPALARVRDPAELAKLPNDARQDWEAFWIEVQNHLAPHDPRRPPGT
jgi:hypothetical protein